MPTNIAVAKVTLNKTNSNKFCQHWESTIFTVKDSSH